MASTAFEMLTLSPCRKMMVFSMDAGIESDLEADAIDNCETDGGKRLHSDADDNSDRGHVKKRRKQSKPVRIASSESLSDGEVYPESETPEKHKESAESNGETRVGVEKETVSDVIDCRNQCEDYITSVTGNEESCAPEKNNRSNESHFLLPINLSSTKSSANISDSFVRSEMSDNQDQNVSTPRPSQDIDINRYQETCCEGAPYKKDNIFSSSTSPHSFPSVKPVHITHTPNSNAHQSGSPLRIFNPEAFCDLCNKEFCNKYFLKTHKANKHGIYIDSAGPNLMDAVPSMPFINYFSNVSEVLPSNNSHVSRPAVPLRKPQLPTIPSSVPSSQQQQQNATVFSLKNMASGNMRAFCNICQREFCNKYFVRRHKAKIHGIIDTSIPDYNDGSELRNQGFSDSNQGMSFDERYEDNPINCSKLASGTICKIDSTDGQITNTAREQSGVIQQQTTIVTQQQQQLSQTPHISAEEDSLENASSESASGLNVNLSSTYSIFGGTQQIDDLNREVGSPGERIRKVGGAFNSEAFCDICCKEYCNKYFLRTHKLKSHGIILQDCDKRDDKLNSGENSPLYNSQAVPLNLIVGDQTSLKTEKYSTDDENSVIYCNTCGQTFKNVFLLKMHTSYMHLQDDSERNTKILPKNNSSVSPDQEEDTTKKPNIKPEVHSQCENSQKSMTDDEKGFFFEFQNLHSSTVKCEICHKTVQQSSLENHIESEHSNLLEEMGALGEEENSDSQISVHRLQLDCNICQKKFSSPSALEQHVLENHATGSDQTSHCNLLSIRMQIAKENEELIKSSNAPSTYSQAEIQTTPTSSFCEICKKELCNKYFMKTHMQRMHGISIENGAHIGGVVCDICNKELCSKYFLRVHKQNSHGIIDDVLGLDMSRNQSPNGDHSLKPSEHNDLQNRYFSHFTEVCGICSRRFRSMKWLKAHLLNDHGEEGKEKWKEFQVSYEPKLLKEVVKKSDSMNVVMGNSGVNITTNSNNSTTRSNLDSYPNRFDSTCQLNGNSENGVKSSVFTTIFNGKNTNSKQYQCSYCSFSTSILAFLFVHERSHISGSNLLLDQSQKPRCKVCSLSFENSENYEKHCLSHKATDQSNTVTTEKKEAFHEKSTAGGDSLIQTSNDNGIMPGPRESCCVVKDIKCDTFNSSTIGATDFGELRQNDTEGDASSKSHDEADNEFNSRPVTTNKTTDRTAIVSIKNRVVSDERFPYETELSEKVNEAITKVKESLEFIANRTEIPVSFSVPQSHKEVIMQPFVLEDSGEFLSPNSNKVGFEKSFLSSIVFLPVIERLKSPVMVSFKLTPT